MLPDLVAGPFGPIVVFLLRATDVTMATVRMLLVMRGHRILAPLLGFIEIVIWVAAVGIVVQHLSSPAHVVGFAAGFACGNYFGIRIEERLALGLASIRTVVRTGGTELANALRDAGAGVTVTPGTGMNGAVEVLHSVVPRRAVERCLRIVDQGAPESFVVVDEPRMVRRGWRFRGKKK